MEGRISLYFSYCSYISSDLLKVDPDEKCFVDSYLFSTDLSDAFDSFCGKDISIRKFLTKIDKKTKDLKYYNEDFYFEIENHQYSYISKVHLAFRIYQSPPNDTFTQIESILRNPTEEGQVDNFLLFILEYLGFCAPPSRIATGKVGADSQIEAELDDTQIAITAGINFLYQKKWKGKVVSCVPGMHSCSQVFVFLYFVRCDRSGVRKILRLGRNSNSLYRRK